MPAPPAHRPPSLAEKAYQSLLQQMLSGKLKAGDVVNRRTTAHELGISVAPVLEAMVRLEHEGLLQNHPRSKTVVRTFTLNEMRDLLLLREAIECQAAWLYAGKPIRDQLTRLLPIARKVDATGQNNLASWKADIHFHQALVGMAESAILRRTFEQTMTIGLFAAISHAAPPHETNERMRHEPLLKNLSKASAARCVELIRNHLRRGKSTLFAADN